MPEPKAALDAVLRIRPYPASWCRWPQRPHQRVGAAQIDREDEVDRFVAVLAEDGRPRDSASSINISIRRLQRRRRDRLGRLDASHRRALRDGRASFCLDLLRDEFGKGTSVLVQAGDR